MGQQRFPDTLTAGWTSTLDADTPTDGLATFRNGEYLAIPTVVSLTAGNATGGVVSLIFDDVTCTYNDTGGDLTFTNCPDSARAPGDWLRPATVPLQIVWP